ncbi:MAG: hypothetical protein ACYTG7_06635 [Planctomycetota bacterium]|jgi:hypothetical protein
MDCTKLESNPSLFQGGVRTWMPAFLLLFLLVLVTYAPCLDNFFWEIDDQRHLAHGAGHAFPNNYFRPGQALSFMILWNVAGTDPFPYYLAGLLFHCAASFLFLLLAFQIFERLSHAWLAAALFAVLFAPHQAVLWIGAHLGVQALCFSLAALVFWVKFLKQGGLVPWLAALLFACLAMAFKETGLNLLPWMLVLHLGFKGIRDVFRLQSLAAWIPFVGVAAWIAWRAMTVPGGVGLEAQWQGLAHLAGRLLRSLGHLPLLLEFHRWRYIPGLYWIGMVVLAAPLVGACLLHLFRRAHDAPQGAGFRWALAASGILLGGHAAVLPGEPEIIGDRFYYDAAPGFALVVVVLCLQCRTLLERMRGIRLVPWAVVALYGVLNVIAVHGIEKEKYDRVSQRVEALAASTAHVLDQAPPGRAILFLDPPLPDREDFICMLRVWEKLPDSRMRQEPWRHPQDTDFRKRLCHPRTESPFRWNASENAWIPFEPGGLRWLDEWKPAYWPAGLKDPNLPDEMRFVVILPPEHSLTCMDSTKAESPHGN